MSSATRRDPTSATGASSAAARWTERLLSQGGLRGRRRRRTPRTAFVLSGGGNLGALQVGMLRASLEAGILPDLLVGCSVGAMNGAALAGDPTLRGVRRMEALWARADEFGVMPSSWLPSSLSLARRGSSVHGNDGLRRALDYGLVVDTFEALRVPFCCNATEVDTAEERWFDSGPLIEPILASAALPAIYPPVVIDGRRYLDGGVVDDVPISRAVALGADRLVVMHVGLFQRELPEPRRPIDVARWAFWLARRSRFRDDLEAASEHAEVILMGPGERPAVKFDDFSRSAELIQAGYDAGRATLAEVGLLTAADPSAEPAEAARGPERGATASSAVADRAEAPVVGETGHAAPERTR